MNIAIFTENNKSTGLGHFKRCQAIQQAFDQLNVNVELKINSFKINAPTIFYDIIIIDSYKQPVSTYSTFSKLTSLLVVIDDYNRIDYPARVIINPTPKIDFIYKKDKDKIYLLGEKFTLLQKEFWKPDKKIINTEAKQIFISISASLSKEIIYKFMAQLQEKLPNFVIKATSGTLSTKEMLTTFLESDIVISGGGQTMFELAALGVPTIPIKVAPNQDYILDFFKSIFFVNNYYSLTDNHLINHIVNEVKLFSYNERLCKSKIGKEIIDGKGAIRVVESILKVFKDDNIKKSNKS